MPRVWSQRIAERYRLRLPADVAAWFDQHRWEIPGGGEFDQPLEPARLLDPEPGLIWPGFMQPDTLPLIGNAYGDWLCLRVEDSGGVSELVYWSHAGGDWIPYGATLAEALLYDALRRLAGGAASPGGDEPLDERHVVAQVDWCCQWLPASPGHPGPHELFAADPGRLVANADWPARLRAANVAYYVLARDAILGCLETGLKHRSDYRVAQRIGVPWEPDFVSWMFDTRLIPAARREQLVRHFGESPAELFGQDWDTAERIALEVARRRDDLGWAYDVAGWAAERRGDIGTAVQRYLVGLRSSLFADHTVPFRTHWVADGWGKFAAARLYEHAAELPEAAQADPYVRLFLANHPDTLRQRLSDYWLGAARHCQRQGRPADAYQCYRSAGWDLGLQAIGDYQVILDGMEATAKASGAEALARIAALHGRLLAQQV